MADFSPIEHVQLLGDQTIAARWLPFARRKFKALDRSDDKRFYKRLALADAVIVLRRTGKVRTITISGVGGGLSLLIHGVRKQLLKPTNQDPLQWKARSATTSQIYGDLGWTDGEYVMSWDRIASRNGGGVYFKGRRIYWFDTVFKDPPFENQYRQFSDNLGVYDSIDTEDWDGESGLYWVDVLCSYAKRGRVVVFFYTATELPTPAAATHQVEAIDMQIGADGLVSSHAVATLDITGVLTLYRDAVCPQSHSGNQFVLIDRIGRYAHILYNEDDLTLSIVDSDNTYQSTGQQEITRDPTNIGDIDYTDTLSGSGTTEFSFDAVWSYEVVDGDLVESFTFCTLSVSTVVSGTAKSFFSSLHPGKLDWESEKLVETTGVVTINGDEYPVSYTYENIKQVPSALPGAWPHVDQDTISGTRIAIGNYVLSRPFSNGGVVVLESVSGSSWSAPSSASLAVNGGPSVDGRITNTTASGDNFFSITDYDTVAVNPFPLAISADLVSTNLGGDVYPAPSRASIGSIDRKSAITFVPVNGDIHSRLTDGSFGLTEYPGNVNTAPYLGPIIPYKK